jgi:hypothetical protein
MEIHTDEVVLTVRDVSLGGDVRDRGSHLWRRERDARERSTTRLREIPTPSTLFYSVPRAARSSDDSSVSEPTRIGLSWRHLSLSDVMYSKSEPFDQRAVRGFKENTQTPST